MQEYIPGAHQDKLIQFWLERPRAAWWAGMGTGKTSAAYTALDLLKLMGATKRTLVIAPKLVAATTWVDEQAKWSHLQDIGAPVPVIGTKAQRLAALKQDANVHTINMENIPWLVDQLKRWPWDTVVFDESYRLAGMRSRGGTQRTRALRRVAGSAVDRWLNLTGTPAPNGYTGLWGQTYPLDFGERLGLSYQKYLDRWFKQPPWSRFGWVLAHDACREEIESRLRDIAMTIKAEDYFPIDEPVVVNSYVELPAKARAQYKEMEKTLGLELAKGTSIEAPSMGVLRAKLNQLAAGAVYDADGNWHEIHDAKLQALESIVQEAAGEPILVAYYYKHDLARLTRAFPKARVVDKNPDTLKQWNAGSIPMLIGQPGSMGHGLNLQDGGRRIAFFSLPNRNLEHYQQIIERVGPTRQVQSGHPRTVYVHHIIARGTTDELEVKAMQDKDDLQELLLKAMKEKYL